jgi:tetratricopeptide (TPR) repeat protein
MVRALSELGHYDRARKILGKGLRRFPDSYQLWVCTGGLYANLGDHFKSLKCFETALRFAPEGSWEALYNKAIALEKLGSYGEATEVLDDLIEKHPYEPKFLAERGCCALELGYPQEAIHYYQSAMGLWEQAPSVYEGVCIYSGLCTAYAEMGLKKEAVEIALEGLRRFPDEDPVLYHNVGATFLEMGWKQEAREVLKKGVEKFPEDDELKKFFKDVDNNIDDPENDGNPALLGMLLLIALKHKKLKKKRSCH